MADYQCPTCLETMDRPKYEPVALKCGHIMCSTCLPKTVKRGKANHVCGMCRKECAPQDVYRIYLPTPVRSLAATLSRSSISSPRSGSPLSEAQLKQASAITTAASEAGLESSQPELQNIITSAEHWYVGIEEQSGPLQDTLDALLAALTGLRHKLVYAARLDSAKQLQRKLQLEIDIHKNEIASYEQRFRESELEVARLKREATQWEKRARRSETKSAQWEQQANSIEDRRYTESIRAEGAINILRSQISVLQKEVQEQTRRKLNYKKKYYAVKQTQPKGKGRRCCHAVSDDDSLEIMSSTSTADEAEVSNAFSVPSRPEDKTSLLSGARAQPSPPESQEGSDDDSQIIVYGPPPSQPSQHSKKRKFSNASTSSTCTTLSVLPPLTPEEQSAREADLDARAPKRLRAAQEEGVKEGWLAPDWRAKAVMTDRIKEMKKARKRTREESETDAGSTGAANPSAPVQPVQSGARTIRPRRT